MVWVLNQNGFGLNPLFVFSSPFFSEMKGVWGGSKGGCSTQANGRLRPIRLGPIGPKSSILCVFCVCVSVCCVCVCLLSVCVCLSALCVCLLCACCVCLVQDLCAPPDPRPPWTPPTPDPPPPDRPTISLFFSLSRHNFHSFFSLLGVLSFCFGGVFEAPRRSNVHVWALGLSCEAPAPPRERRKKQISGGREKKSARFWAPHPSGPQPSGPTFSGFGPPPSRPPPLQAHLPRSPPCPPPDPPTHPNNTPTTPPHHVWPNVVATMRGFTGERGGLKGVSAPGDPPRRPPPETPPGRPPRRTSPETSPETLPGDGWPVQFGPFHLGSQFGPFHFWPKLEVGGQYFGQSSQSIFGQSISGSGVCHGPKVVGPQTQKKSGPEGVRAPKVGRPKISRFFCHAPTTSFALFVSHCVSSR